MPEWLQTSLANGADPSPAILAWRIGTALLLGGVVAAIYRWARRGESIQPTFLTTLVLLAGVIAMATQVIGDNVGAHSASCAPSPWSGSAPWSRTPRTPPS